MIQTVTHIITSHMEIGFAVEEIVSCFFSTLEGTSWGKTELLNIGSNLTW